MNNEVTDPSPPPTSPPAVHTPAPVFSPAQTAGSRSGLWLGALALLVFVLGAVMAGLLWQKVDATQKEMARRSQLGDTQATEIRTLATQAQAQVTELKARLAVAEVKLSEVALQRSQLEELMLALSRSRDDNLVQDLESSLRLGQQQSELTGSVQPLLAALQAADARIARAAQPRLNSVQRAIARDVQRIRSAAVADVPSLVQRLDELVRQVDQWPVPNDVGQRRSGSPGHSAPTQVQTPAAGSGWEGLWSHWTAFWTQVWHETTRSGRELVRVSRIDSPDAVLLAPEQAFFLRENLKLKLLNARLGLLARQMDAVQEDLKNIDAALARHFDTTQPQVAAAQAMVTQLRSELAVTEWPQPADSLAALAVAAGGR